jgi:hypothetical protein
MASKSKNFFTVYDYISMICANEELPKLMGKHTENLKKNLEDEEKRKKTIKANKELKEQESKNMTFKYISIAIKSCTSPAVINQVRCLLEKMNELYDLSNNSDNFTLFIEFIKKKMTVDDNEKYLTYFDRAVFANSVLKGVSKENTQTKNEFIKKFYNIIFDIWPKKNFSQKGTNPEPHLKDVSVPIEGSVFEKIWKK